VENVPSVTCPAETLSRVTRVIVERLGANVTEAELRGVARLDDIVPLDSIGLLEFTVGLEQEFAIRFEQDSLERSFLLDVAGLVKYLDARAGSQPR
jgi:acyl carrier protein